MIPWRFPRWIAHRGAGKLAPENTLAAFRVGAAHGFRAFECDVKLSADGVPFLLHDSDLERTTSGTGIAGDRSWDTLSRLDAGSWHGRAHAGEPLASLHAVARFCLANHLALDIEIKSTPGRADETGRTVAKQAARWWANAASPPLLSSFDTDALEAAKVAAPGLPRALLLDSLAGDWFERAQALGCVAVVTNHAVTTSAVVDRLHAGGLRVLVYTVNEPTEAAHLLHLGVDGIVTDAVDRFAPAAV